MKKIVNGKAVEVDEPGAFVTVRRPQLIALLQVRFIGEGMTDESALDAAQRAVIGMAIEPPDATAAIAEARAEGYAAGRAEVEQEWTEADIDRGDYL